jgi:hypothetical protein
MTRSQVVPLIQRLDPTRDYDRIVFLSTFYDFPYDSFVACNRVLMRAFTLPRISQVVSTLKFGRNSPVFYNKTVTGVLKLLWYGSSRQPSGSVFDGINREHRQFQVPAEDLLYVSSRFVLEPVEWNRQFGWRPFCEQERLALFYFWQQVCRQLNAASFPSSYGELERFSHEYEKKHRRAAKSNRYVYLMIEGVWVDCIPRWWQWCSEAVLRSLLGPELRRDLMLPAPPPWGEFLVDLAMRLRSWALKFWPARQRPFPALFRARQWCHAHGVPVVAELIQMTV